MKKQRSFTILLFLTLNLTVFSQENLDSNKCSEFIDLGKVKESNEDFSTFEPLKSTLKDVEIVMLGEQSHGEGTAYETKIKLIKYLHQEMGFDLLVFESGIYSCNKAWENIKKGDDVRTSLANSIFYLWATTKQFKPLVKYIDENKNSEHPLIISGFDNQLTGRLSENNLVTDLKKFILNKDKSILDSKEWKNVETSLQYLLKYELKEYDKEQAVKDTTFINTLITKTNSNDSTSQFWHQVLKSTKYYISDTKLKTNFRDKQMAENLIWIKEQNPNKKIICWGATSHFLYNSSEIKMIGFPYNVVDNYYGKQPMMGQYLKEKYKSKIFTIGFIAYQGEFGLTGKHKIKPAKENSLEYLIGKSGFENCFLNLNQCNSGKLISRPLANKYMKNSISNVMDGVIFNRNMERSRLDRNFFLKIFPENKWIKPEVEVEE
tara:strand:+ start:67 stop:1368 length:1302 start_codon:yes stop_codon:yes gene_type:complete